MRTNNVSRTSFQAHVPPLLKEKLMIESIKRNKKVGLDFVNQLKKVETWGDNASEIGEISLPQVKETFLGLVNHLIVPFKKSMLPDKGSLLDSFMALTEKDIIKAENNLTKYV